MILVAGIALAACARPHTPNPAPNSLGGELDGLLPDVAGFAASPVEHGQEFVRRSYTRGAVRLSVTLSRTKTNPDAFSQWVKMSTDYPGARLPEGASGFYDCKGQGTAERCDLHAQLRTGYHLEVFSGGTATRADLDALARGLPLESLSR